MLSRECFYTVFLMTGNMWLQMSSTRIKCNRTLHWQGANSVQTHVSKIVDVSFLICWPLRYYLTFLTWKKTEGNSVYHYRAFFMKMSTVKINKLLDSAQNYRNVFFLGIQNLLFSNLRLNANPLVFLFPSLFPSAPRFAFHCLCPWIRISKICTLIIKCFQF